MQLTANLEIYLYSRFLGCSKSMYYTNNRGLFAREDNLRPVHVGIFVKGEQKDGVQREMEVSES